MLLGVANIQPNWLNYRAGRAARKFHFDMCEAGVAPHGNRGYKGDEINPSALRVGGDEHWRLLNVDVKR